MYLARFALLAVCIVATMAVIALIAGTAFFFQHHRSERTSAQTADAEFQRLRVRFADQRPLLDMQERRSVSDVGGPQPGAPLRSFNTIIFDTRRWRAYSAHHGSLSVCAFFRTRRWLPLARRT